MIYFDNAATTGVKPQCVIRAVNTALREYSANPGRSSHEPSIKTATAVFEAREKASEFFGASGPENVIFTMNCTHSLNCVIKGILKPGDHAIVSTLEHNAVMRPLVKSGVAYDMARVSLTDDNETIKEFEKRIRPNTKLIICTGASNVLGKILPIRQIGSLCKKKGIRFAVDAAQTAGVLPINMRAMNIDYLCVAPHKGLYAPMGVGILICEKPIENTIIEGGTGTNSIQLVQPESFPERMESGTINVPAIVGTAAGIDYVKSIGIGKIFHHETELCKQMYEELRKIPGVKLYTPDPIRYNYAPLISFNIGDNSSSDVANLLSDKGIAVRGGLHCAPMAHRQINTLENGTVRVCMGTFNTNKEVSSFINTLKSLKIV